MRMCAQKLSKTADKFATTVENEFSSVQYWNKLIFLSTFLFKYRTKLWCKNWNQQSSNSQVYNSCLQELKYLWPQNRSQCCLRNAKLEDNFWNVCKFFCQLSREDILNYARMLSNHVQSYRGSITNIKNPLQFCSYSIGYDIHSSGRKEWWHKVSEHCSSGRCSLKWYRKRICQVRI